ncbi:MAG: hypothetical protein CMQ75_03845 [Gammaproteobacteria bacterium]|nr:hypothetical protein [Gammaproteobacteria bacterium]|tara:strand:+ start:1461 stop:1775 length:315 start_codon:yes stop_codon:yes gene_type:complete
MALTSTVVTNQNTTIISGTAGKIRAVTCLFFCNTHASNADDVTIYAIASGGTASDSNTIIKSASIDATDTLTFDTEKLLLDPTDSLVGVTTNGTISATATYTDV